MSLLRFYCLAKARIIQSEPTMASCSGTLNCRAVHCGNNFTESNLSFCFSQQELCIRGPAHGVFNHKMLLALSSCLHRLESLSFYGFHATSVSISSVQVSPLKGIIHFPSLKTLHLPRTFLSNEDLQLVLDCCPSLVEARVVPQGDSIFIKHEKLEVLSVGSMTVPCSSLRLHAPALRALEIKSINSIIATELKGLEQLVMKEGASHYSCNSQSYFMPLPLELRHLHVDSKFYRCSILEDVIDLVTANCNLLLTLELLSSGSIPLYETPYFDADYTTVEYLIDLSTAVQMCVGVTRLALDAAMLCHMSFSHARTSGDFRFPALSSLRLFVWDIETFCAERGGDDVLEQQQEHLQFQWLTWAQLVDASAEGSPNLRTLRLQIAENPSVRALGSFCRGQARLPKARFIFEEERDPLKEDGFFNGMRG